MSKYTLPQGLSQTEAKMPSSPGIDFSALEGIYIEFGDTLLRAYASKHVHEFNEFFTDDSHQTVVHNVLDVLIEQTVKILTANCDLTTTHANILTLVHRCPFNFQSKDNPCY
jgi:hypothetical protein